jgi:hypothetical protein
MCNNTLSFIPVSHKRNLANNIGGGRGRAKVTMGIRNFILQGVKYKNGKIGPIKRKCFIFSVYFLPLFNSVTKKIPKLKKYRGGGHFSPLPLPPGYAYAAASLIRHAYEIKQHCATALCPSLLKIKFPNCSFSVINSGKELCLL